MAPKRANARDATPSAPPQTGASSTTASTTSSAAPTTAAAPRLHKGTTSPPTWDQVVGNIVNRYLETTPQRTKLIDVFMAFLVVVGALQFLYCILAGNYPFNAFLSGFAATVGQFVLTASLRLQTTEANKSDFPAVSPERAFADYIVCSLILHFFCVNFIN
ncbi:hypothetical protein VTK73DRAFT_4979 [Phialemonium thermophilum]|uniref:Dolichyl-diphosphooligosaccharide--protein glycosyltransferase subunit OST2 n=1 Tax=Phialemonium thermophilum TaxID=223376 RepID=A0ABR3XXV0_9PEZI